MPDGHPIQFAHFNALPATQAADLLQRACGSRRWAVQVAAARPFVSWAALLDTAERVWGSLSRDDYLEAFSHHPRIGGAAPAGAPSAELSRREQAGMAAASDQVRRTFLELNQQYENRFHHVFLICASGKSAGEMLALLRQRLGNDPEVELRIAAAEQARITRLRLDKLITP